MPLEKYREKRDFKKTTEPPGKVRKTSRAGPKPLSFVVHKHKATHLHWDLRLELDGVLKSWAVPKRPTVDPDEKRLAMMVEDHPLEYGGFEGIIPPGNYGAGTVMIWDEGTYHAAHHEDRGESEEALRQGLDKGHISVVFDGKRLKGEFAIVRIKKAGDASWLMIKKHDEFAGPDAPGPQSEDRSALTGRTMEEIALGKEEPHKGIPSPRDVDLRGAPKSAVPPAMEPMLATLVDEPFDRAGWFFEIKWDGYRVIARLSGGSVRLYSRNGKVLNERFPPIAESLKRLPFNAVLDGEVVVVDENGRSDFQLLQNYMHSGEGNLVYYVFDVLHFRGHDLTGLPLSRRKSILARIMPDPPLPYIRISEDVEEKGTVLFHAAAENNLEGIIAKDGASPYRAGTRSREWLKVKTAMRQEAVIGGFTEPRGGRKFFGSLLLGVYDNGDFVYIGHSGGGFTDEGLKDLRARMGPLRATGSPFKVPPQGQTGVTWVRPELVCEVRFTEWTADGLLRQPVFAGLREDKDPREVRRETPRQAAEVLPRARFHLAGGQKKIVEIGGRRLELSNLDKVFWPAEGYTKGDLIDYYRSVAPVILPHLKDRPQSLRRSPNGIEGEDFFQKDVGEGVPGWVQTVNARSGSEEKEITYLLCQDEATLVFMANWGCIEINPWNSRYQNPDNPDYVVLDLDPLDIDFQCVVEAALSTREILDNAGARGYCKTSGATGLHIYIPVNGKYSTEQVQQFAQIINTLVYARLPKTTSLERMPSRRLNKVYLDFLQNRRGQTMASAYCVRPRRGATVSAPLEWAEVNESLDPANFHIRNMADRIRDKGDLWKPVLGRGINMEKCLERLSRLR